jgi:hypothetical protein
MHTAQSRIRVGEITGQCRHPHAGARRGPEGQERVRSIDNPAMRDISPPPTWPSRDGSDCPRNQSTHAPKVRSGRPAALDMPPPHGALSQAWLAVCPPNCRVPAAAGRTAMSASRFVSVRNALAATSSIVISGRAARNSAKIGLVSSTSVSVVVPGRVPMAADPHRLGGVRGHRYRPGSVSPPGPPPLPPGLAYSRPGRARTGARPSAFRWRPAAETRSNGQRRGETPPP